MSFILLLEQDTNKLEREIQKKITRKGFVFKQEIEKKTFSKQTKMINYIIQ